MIRPARRMPLLALVATALLLMPTAGWAMHISEGILPAGWAIFWFAVATPFVAWGVRQITRKKQLDPAYIPLLGIFGAAVFVFSCFPIPVPVAGSTAHPAGSMGVMGSFSGFAAFWLGRALGLGLFWCGFFAGVAADLLTYLGTSFEMALALHGTQSFWSVLGQIYLAFMPTQVPLSLLEGVVTGGILVYVNKHRPDILRKLKVLKEAAI